MRDIFRGIVVKKFLFFNPLKLYMSTTTCKIIHVNYEKFHKFFTSHFICWCDHAFPRRMSTKYNTDPDGSLCHSVRDVRSSEGGFIEMHTRKQHGVSSRVAWTTLLRNTNTPICAPSYLSSSSLFHQSCRRRLPLSRPNFTLVRFTYQHQLRIEVGAWLRASHVVPSASYRPKITRRTFKRHA